MEGSEYVFFPAVSDYLLEADTLMGNAAVMHVSGGSWTIGTGNYDGINYGLFYSDRVMERVIKQPRRRGPPPQGQKSPGWGMRTRHPQRVAHSHVRRADPPQVVNCIQYPPSDARSGKLP